MEVMITKDCLMNPKSFRKNVHNRLKKKDSQENKSNQRIMNS